MVSVIIPAYNEAPRIGQVLRPLLRSEYVANILVVNDGSQDGTGEAAAVYPVELLNLPENRGKAEAVKAGLAQRLGRTVLLLDADLVGLTPRHVERLVLPVLSGSCHMTVGQFSSGRLLTYAAQQIAPALSGQRCLDPCLIEGVLRSQAKGFSLELALNDLSRQPGVKMEWVLLEQLSHVTKEEKRGLYEGALARFKMYQDIVKYWMKE